MKINQQVHFQRMDQTSQNANKSKPALRDKPEYDEFSVL